MSASSFYVWRNGLCIADYQDITEFAYLGYWREGVIPPSDHQEAYPVTPHDDK